MVSVALGDSNKRCTLLPNNYFIESIVSFYKNIYFQIQLSLHIFKQQQRVESLRTTDR